MKRGKTGKTHIKHRNDPEGPTDLTIHTSE